MHALSLTLSLFNAFLLFYFFKSFSVAVAVSFIIIIIDVLFVYILLSYYFTVNVLVISSTVATANMWVGLCANIFTVEK